MLRTADAAPRALTKPGLAVRVMSLVGALLTCASVARAERKWFDPEGVYAVPTGDAPSRGEADALVTIVEFSDYACKYCNRAERTLGTLARISEDIRVVYRHLPLDEEDTLVAEAGLAAAAQGAFWPMHDRLFAVHGRVDRAGLELIAADLGLDLVRFRGDLDARSFRDEVLADARVANELGVTGTPMFFVNGRPLRGAQPLGTFLAVIDEERARAADAVASGIAPDALYPHLIAAGKPAADLDDLADTPQPILDPLEVYRVGVGLDGHRLGPDDALVTVVEWSDYQCPYCGDNTPVLAKLREEYGDDVRLIFRHLPLAFHPDAALAAEASVEAAAQGKFWAFHDRLFADQEHLARADLERVAADLGLDLDRFRAALDERRHRDAVADDAAAGNALGVTGTPTMFVNGTPIEGAPSYEQLKLIVEIRKADAESLVAHGVARQDVYGVVMAAAREAERGDPSRMPRTSSAARLELLQADREAAVEAACRGRDAARAGEMAGRLKDDFRDDARATCEAYGIDLPP